MIYRDSPADKAVLLLGDRVLSINGRAVEKNYYHNLRMQSTPGTLLSIEVERKGKKEMLEFETYEPMR
jgi:C-terminal processing protease CtpA/Prc